MGSNDFRKHEPEFLGDDDVNELRPAKRRWWFWGNTGRGKVAEIKRKALPPVLPEIENEKSKALIRLSWIIVPAAIGGKALGWTAGFITKDYSLLDHVNQSVDPILYGVLGFLGLHGLIK